MLALTADLEPSDQRDELRLYGCNVLLSQGGWRVGISADDAEAVFTEGRELADRARDVDKAIALCVGHGAILGFRGNLRRYLERAHEAVDLIDESTSRGPAAAALAFLSYASCMTGRLEEALQASERSLELARGHPDAGVETTGFSIWGTGLQQVGELLAYVGRLERSGELLREAIEVSRTHGLVEALSWALNVTADRLHLMGVTAPDDSAGDALRNASESVQVAERSGSPFSLAHAYRGLGSAHLINGHWDDAARTFEQAIAIARERSGLEREGQCLAQLSQAHLGANDPARAREFAVQAIACARDQGADLFQALAQLTMARALRAESGLGEADAIADCLDRARELVEQTGARTLEPQILEERARLAALSGADPSLELTRAQELYVETGATGHAQRLAREIGFPG